MNTILVWILITVGGSNSNQVVYSQPMVDLESCQRLQKEVKGIRPTNDHRAQCVQIRIPK
jgi:hypothetical protein